MNQKTSITWMTTVGAVGILFGVFYAFFGLAGLPAYRVLIPQEVISPWSNGLYGSIFIAFSVVLLCGGRHAFRKNDKELMKILLYGVYAWLIIEAGFSVYYSVYFNVGVDILLAIVLGYPLIKGIRSPSVRG